MDLERTSWPISATATAVLRAPRLRDRDLVQLAVKELVLSGAWRLDRPHVASRADRGGRIDLASREELDVPSSRRELLLCRGDRPVPAHAPLPRLDAGLRLVADGGGADLRRTIRQMLQVDVHILEEARAAVERELLNRGLATVRRRWGGLGGTRLERTPEGEGLLADAEDRQSELRDTVDAGGDVGSSLGALGALVVLAEADVVAALAKAVRPRGIEELVGEVWAAEVVTWPQLFAEADQAAGAIDGGGGGDGGGAGDGGGGHG